MMQRTQSDLEPIELLVVQGTGFCNLNCKYCYLTEESRRNKKKLSISDLRIYFQKILSSRFVKDKLVISWHSGEPLVLGTDYYEEAIAAISEIAAGSKGKNFEILHDFQTNGTLIDNEWCDFFQRHAGYVSVGISCDGPEELHDAYRLGWNGSGSFEKTVRGINLLSEYGVVFSLIAVVSPLALENPKKFFEFFNKYRDCISEFRYNLLDEFSDSGEFSYEVAREGYASFLSYILDRLANQEPEDTLLNVKNFSYFYERLFATGSLKRKLSANYMSSPLRSLTLSANGDVSTFYAGVSIDECPDIYGDGKGLVIGNLKTESIEQIAASDKLHDLIGLFRHSHSVCQRSCSHFDLCPGGYNLIKLRRNGSLESVETPECRIQVKTFADTLMEHMSKNLPATS